MKVIIKLFATLRDGRGKIVEDEYDEGTQIHQIIKDLNIEEKEIAILLKNGILAKTDDVINEGDYLSVFPPVGGGWYLVKLWRKAVKIPWGNFYRFIY